MDKHSNVIFTKTKTIRIMTLLDISLDISLLDI